MMSQPTLSSMELCASAYLIILPFSLSLAWRVANCSKTSSGPLWKCCTARKLFSWGQKHSTALKYCTNRDFADKSFELHIPIQLHGHHKNTLCSWHDIPNAKTSNTRLIMSLGFCMLKGKRKTLTFWFVYMHAATFSLMSECCPHNIPANSGRYLQPHYLVLLPLLFSPLHLHGHLHHGIHYIVRAKA